MEFNGEKCKEIYAEITMERKSGERVELEEARSERDLYVFMNNKLKWDDQVDPAALKATFVLRILKRTFVHWNARSLNQIILHLRKAAS